MEKNVRVTGDIKSNKTQFFPSGTYSLVGKLCDMCCEQMELVAPKPAQRTEETEEAHFLSSEDGE